MKAGQILSLLAVVAGTAFGMKRKAPEDEEKLRNVRPKYWAPPAESLFLGSLITGLEQDIFDGSAETVGNMVTLVSSVLEEGIYTKDHSEKLLPVLGTALQYSMNDDELHARLLSAIARYLHAAPETASTEDFADFIAFVDPLLKGERWSKPISPSRRKHTKLIGPLLRHAPGRIRATKHSLPEIKSLCHFFHVIRECLAVNHNEQAVLDIKEALRDFISEHISHKEKVNELLNEQDRQFVEARIALAHKEQFGHLGSKELNTALRSGTAQEVRDILRYGCPIVTSKAQLPIDIFFHETILPLDILELMLEDPKVNPSHRKNSYFIQSAHQMDLARCKALLKDKRFDPTLDNGAILVSAAQKGQISVLRLLLEDGRLEEFRERAKAVANQMKQTEAVLNLALFGRQDALDKTLKLACTSASEFAIKALLAIPGANHVLAFNTMAENNRIELLKTFISMPNLELTVDCIVPDELLGYLGLIHAIRRYNVEELAETLMETNDLEMIEWALVATIRHMDDKMLALVIQKISYMTGDLSAYKYLGWIEEIIKASCFGSPSISYEQMEDIISIIRRTSNF